MTGRPLVKNGSVTFHLRATGPGVAYAYVWDGEILGQTRVDVTEAGPYTATVQGTTGTLAVAFDAKAGGTTSVAAPLG
jgi:hypothetical protein